MLLKIIEYFYKNIHITILLFTLIITAGIITSPFGDFGELSKKYKVPVDAIPDIGENQQIVFTKWDGRSPQDIDDQITYPLSSALLGIPKVKTIRSNSMFGFSSIYIIFDDDVEFYWSRSRIIEKLNSLPENLLPEGVKPTLGPDATGLGQIFWYTLDGYYEDGLKGGNWSPEEKRSIQDYYVKYALSSVEGVSEVASIGGFVKEYLIEIDPQKIISYEIPFASILNAVKSANLDIGASSVEINSVEYFIRGLGYIKNIEDLEKSIVMSKNNTIYKLKDIANISFAPMQSRGILDDGGYDATGGVITARFGENPLHVVENIKAKIAEISAGLPEKIDNSGKVSKLKITPFYDRSVVIKETLGTLKTALVQEVLFTFIVVLIMALSIKASIIISFLIPVSVLMTFVFMKLFGVDANVVAISGIAIAIGTIVDVGIVLLENMQRFIKEKKEEYSVIILNSVKEVIPSVFTAIMTTIISFIPVFLLESSEGKLFKPLAFTKSFILISSLVSAIIFIPIIGKHLLKKREKSYKILILKLATLTIITTLLPTGNYIYYIISSIVFSVILIDHYVKWKFGSYLSLLLSIVAVFLILLNSWNPVTGNSGEFTNFLFILLIVLVPLGAILIFRMFYIPLLTFFIKFRKSFLSLVIVVLLFGIMIWTGFSKMFYPVEKLLSFTGVNVKDSYFYKSIETTFPGLGTEFMPKLDEGAFLLMPTSLPHSGISFNRNTLARLDKAVSEIPEVDKVIGKAGRVESPLDPAPLSMFENIILYKPEFILDENGERVRFKTDENGNFLRDKDNNLIKDNFGSFFRNWRDSIKSTDDIWNEIVKKSNIPGITSAPKLQPIETRIVMLQTGMRAPMGIQISGQSLSDIEFLGSEFEKILKGVKEIKGESVFADKVVGKPYLQIIPDREKLAQYGISVRNFMDYLQFALSGKIVDKSVEGKERYNIRVRYPISEGESVEAIENIPYFDHQNNSLLLKDVAKVKFDKGPQVIKSENSFYVSYVIFDKKGDISDGEAVEKVKSVINHHIDIGEIKVPKGTHFEFTGNYKNQIRAQQRLAVIVPVVLFIVFFIIYMQFRKITPSLIIFSAIAVTFSGGFILIWLYGQDWFLNFSLFGTSLSSVFNTGTVNISVAVWVGFIALFGVATDDGVLMTGYLEQSFDENKPATKEEIKAAIIDAGLKRINPCLMTTATTILALLPVLTSSGKGGEIMKPMAIPIVGGMTIELLTLFIIPVIYSIWKERSLKSGGKI
ncbi:MAG: efflux RND transporter permease subunit [Candidatus Delongbacteria bacterium]|nr:efflux RND transporter permease subunit [Candidatus Delongbacteria bacterium]MBN2835251.1 efflux RND transporter permease subunit [Candidatus Delongbacteria bacterium]